jgi:tetratricopeptide (TPR) repeat protein
MPKMKTNWLAPSLVVLLLAQACGGAGNRESTLPPVGGPGGLADARELGQALRAFYLLEPGDALRGPLRDQILAYLARTSDEVIASGSYEKVVDHLASMTELYSPDELASATLSPLLEPPARFVLERGSTEGDEGRVLAALLLLGRLHPDDPDLAARYSEVSSWGRAARAELPSDFDRYSQLIRIWDVHALLTPDETVLETLAELHVARRDAAMAAFRNPRAMMGMGGPPPQQVLGLAPLDVAGVFLRHGDLAKAIAEVEAMGGGGSNVTAFVAMLRTAEQSDAEGGEAILQLAEFYRQARPEVARGLCILGRRRFQADGRFPACLARVAGDQQRYAQATAWYAEAIERAPDLRDVYDEALAQLNQFIEEGLFESDPSEARALAEDAERILRERRERFPNVAPPVPEERFLFLLGMLEMNAGNPADARTRFEASVALRPTPEALLALGQVLERTDAAADAARRYREALDLVDGGEPGADVRRAEILEHMGDALTGAGEAAQGSRMYRQALEIWTQAIASITPESQAMMEQLGTRGRGLLDVRRGVLLDKLDRREEARQAFHRALDTSGNTRQVFATILSHLAIARPDAALATEVFREALRQTSLEPEWKVYFGLWLRLVAARAGEEAAATAADSVFAQVSGDGAWSGRLARFASGAIDYDQLLGSAADRGQRTEALFYEGVRRLSSGDREGARALFDEVLETGMVSYFEFIMAQELIRASEVTPSSPQASAATPAPSAAPAAP